MMTDERWLWLPAIVTSLAVHVGGLLLGLSQPNEPEVPPAETDFVIDAMPLDVVDPAVSAIAPDANGPSDQPSTNMAEESPNARAADDLETNVATATVGTDVASDVVADREPDAATRPDRPDNETALQASERIAARQATQSAPGSRSAGAEALDGVTVVERVGQTRPGRAEARQTPVLGAEHSSPETIDASESEAVVAMSEAIRSEITRMMAPLAIIEPIAPSRVSPDSLPRNGVEAAPQDEEVVRQAPAASLPVRPSDGTAVVPDEAAAAPPVELFPSGADAIAPERAFRLGSLGTQTLTPLGLPESEVLAGEEGGGPSASPDAAEVIRFIKGYATGRCFAAMPSRASNDRIVIEGLSNSAARLSDFEEQIAAAVDFPLTIQTGQITDAQCRALSFLTYSKDYPVSQLRLQIDRRNVATGAELSGKISGIDARKLTVLIVDDEGIVQQVPDRFFSERSADQARFVVPLSATAGLFDTANIALAITTPDPLRTAQEADAANVETYFEQLAVELAEPGNASSDLAFAFFYIRGAGFE
ncbi:hypothetical protein [Fulvimarina sp. MAC3]|uniref:hypothetical protein n=1 Tax=Fulvimarina sp. MAC3 TaxID=3148887 RepID=UPI0031FE3C03